MRWTLPPLTSLSPHSAHQVMNTAGLTMVSHGAPVSVVIRPLVLRAVKLSALVEIQVAPLSSLGHEPAVERARLGFNGLRAHVAVDQVAAPDDEIRLRDFRHQSDRKSTRLNSSHLG